MSILGAHSRKAEPIKKPKFVFSGLALGILGAQEPVMHVRNV
jgi:hypothetical protein